MLKIFIIALAILIPMFSFAQQLSVEALVREARVSNTLSDRFKAYRIMSFLKDKRPESFYKEGLQEYLESLFRLTSQKKFIAECTSLSKIKNQKIKNIAMYTCGRLLTDVFLLHEAENFLSQVSADAETFVQASILLATLSLGDSEGEKCLKILNPKVINKIKNSNTKDLYYITRARCLIEINQTDKAILQYQQISSTSSYYFDALEETAWAQFKIRRLESARTLLDVIVTTYETRFGDKKQISPSTYFRCRYLQAYIELIERDNKRAEEQFRGLKDSINKYTLTTFISEDKVRSMVNTLASENLKWIDTKAAPKEIRQQLDMVQQWSDTRARKRIDFLIDVQFSLSRELQRLRDNPNPEFKDYEANLVELSVRNRTALESEMIRAARGIERVLRVVKIKAELGSSEIIWSQRAEGVRSIGELLETYQREIDEVEDYFTTL